MNTKTKGWARNKGNPYFLRVPWNKGGLVNTGPGRDVYTTQDFAHGQKQGQVI